MSVTIPVILLPLLVAEPTSLAAVLTVMVSVGTLSVRVIPVSVEPLVLVIVMVNVMSCPGVTLLTLAVLVMLNKAVLGVEVTVANISVTVAAGAETGGSGVFGGCAFPDVLPVAIALKMICGFAWSAVVTIRVSVNVAVVFGCICGLPVAPPERT